MATKRDYSDLDDGEIPEPSPKRTKQQSSKPARQHQNSSIDPTWGQKYVFSNQEDDTTIPQGEESDFEDDADAMAYLRSVRHEAYGIPHLLVAPKVQIGPQLPAELQTNGDDHDEPIDRNIYKDPMTDTRGWYHDGAYMARPSPEQEDDYEGNEALDEEGIPEKAIHKAYYTALLDQYNHLRRVVHTQPPPNSTLPSTIPTLAVEGKRGSAAKFWSGYLRRSDPLPLQVARFSKDSVLCIIRFIIGGKFLRQGYPIEERTSRWLWALLARLPDRGELDYSDIGWVRELGRRAVLLGRSLSEMAALREELAEEGLGVHEGVDAKSSDEDALASEDGDNPGVEQQGSRHADTTMPTSDYGQHGDPLEPASTQAQPLDDTTLNPTPDEGKVLKQLSAEVAANIGVETVEKDDNDQEEGEVEDDDDVAMDLASNSSAEEAPATIGLDDAKAMLLERLARDEHVDAQEAAKERSRVNMRATLNMILTVVGEFYGQRDLLEFREPFVGL